MLFTTLSTGYQQPYPQEEKMRTERKFDDDFIREVHQMHKRKYPITDIAKKYNISTYMVRRLINTAVLEVETEGQKEETEKSEC